MKNKKLHQKKNLEKSPKYALRKLSVGVASWIIGWTYFSVGAEIIQPVSKEGSIEGGYEIKNSGAPIEGLGEELIFEDITDFPEGNDTNPRKDFSSRILIQILKESGETNSMMLRMVKSSLKGEKPETKPSAQVLA